MLLALLLAAAEKLPLVVSYDAAPGCPEQSMFESELRLRSARIELVTDRAAAQEQLAVTVKKVKGRFVGTSSLHPEREFKAAQCEAVLAALSLAVALLLDPEGARTAPLAPGEIAAPSPPPAAETSPLPPAPPEPDPAPQPVVEAAPPAPPVVEQPRWSFAVLAGAGVSSAVSGAVDPSLQLQLFVQRGLVAAYLTPMFVFTRTVYSAAGRAIYRGFGVRLDGVVSFELSRVVLQPGLQLSALFVPIVGADADEPRPGTSVLVAPGPVVHVVVPISAFRIAAEAGLGFNLRRESYVVEGAGTVFTAPAVWGFAGVALGRTF